MTPANSDFGAFFDKYAPKLEEAGVEALKNAEEILGSKPEAPPVDAAPAEEGFFDPYIDFFNKYGPESEGFTNFKKEALPEAKIKSETGDIQARVDLGAEFRNKDVLTVASSSPETEPVFKGPSGNGGLSL